MPEPWPLILAYDGSDDAANAIANAARLFAPRPALVVHVFEGLADRLVHAGLPGLTSRLEEAAADLAEQERDEGERLAQQGAELARSAGFEAEPVAAVQSENAWHTLLGIAVTHDGCAMVAGSRGRSGIRSALLGSVSTGLVQHGSLPMLIVPSTASPDARGGPALLCYDDSEASRRAIEQAGRLLRGRRASVLHVWQSWLAQLHGSLAAAVVRGMARELETVAAEQSAEIVAAGVDWAMNCGWRAEARSASCDHGLWRGVIDAADEGDASVIVMGSRGLSGVSASLGSVSHGVVHHARRPVLVVPGASAGNY